MLKRIWILLLSMFILVILTPFTIEARDHLLKKGRIIEPDGATKTRLVKGYGNLPLHFEANQGQVEGTVRFFSRGSGYGLFLTSTEAVLALRRANRTSEKIGSDAVNPHAGILRMKWEGANRKPRIEGMDQLEGKSNYFIGNNPDQWRTNIPLYRKVRYRDLYPGIDLSDICKEERTGLRQCKDCGIVFCHWCMLADHPSTGGQIIQVFPVCPNPKCKGTNIVELT